MLSVEDTGIDRLGKRHVIQDEERSVTFTHLGALAMGTIDAFRLSVGELEVPVSANSHLDGERLIYTNVSVTGSIPFEKVYGVAGRGYQNASKELEMLEMAAECLLVYGGYYDGLTSQYDKTWVQLRDGTRTLKDYGY